MQTCVFERITGHGGGERKKKDQVYQEKRGKQTPMQDMENIFVVDIIMVIKQHMLIYQITKKESLRV